MNTSETDNYIGVAYEEANLTDIPESYLKIYEADIKKALNNKQKLNALFAYWHYRLNTQLKLINSYIKKGYFYFQADKSRALLTLLSDILGFIKKFQSTAYEFVLDNEYELLIGELNGFIGSMGTNIPEGFHVINIVFRPIFTYTNKYISKENKKYELKLIGEGAFAKVYKYLDKEYDCYFALKKLKISSNSKDLERFKKEYELMKKYEYPYIVKVYRFDDVKCSYTMEFCPSNLKNYIKHNNTKLSFKQRKKIATQLLKGLLFLHSKGVLHRDLSFTNILVYPYEDLIIVKLSDFGLAKDDAVPITNTDSSIKGTIIDPCLDSFKNYDVQNEIYVLGFILYFIFTGRENFYADDTAISVIVSKCINTNKNERYADIQELLNDILQIKNLSDKPIIKTSLSDLKSQIIEALYPISANVLPDACVSIGLATGDSNEAFRSKRMYISKRLYGFDRNGCIQLITAIKELLDIEIES